MYKEYLNVTRPHRDQILKIGNNDKGFTGMQRELTRHIENIPITNVLIRRTKRGDINMYICK